MGVCGRCGAQSDGSSVFCPGCGAVQTPAAQAPPAPPPPPPPAGWSAGPWGAPPPPPAQPWSTGTFAAPTQPPPGWSRQAPPPAGGWTGPVPYAGPPSGPPPEGGRDPKLLLLVLGTVGVVVVAGVIAFLLLSPHGVRPSAGAAAGGSSTAAPSTASAPTSAGADQSGGTRAVVGTPEAQPSAGGDELSLVPAGADCTYPPSVDGNNQPVTYEPAKAVDNDPTTAWRCPGAGGHTIQFGGSGRATDVGLVPGYAKVDPANGADRFLDNHTVTQAVWRFRHGSRTYQVVQDIPNPTPRMAWLHLSQDISFDTVSVTVTGTGNPAARQNTTPVSEIAVWGAVSAPGD